jgi:hypothetical protein
MGYPAVAKSLVNAGLDIVPGGKTVGGIIKGVGSLFGGKGNKWDKSLAETRAAGKAGDNATLQYKLTNTKYPQVAKSARAYLDLLQAKSTGSRSEGMQWLKARQPVMVGGGGPMTGSSGREQLKAMGHVMFTPSGEYVPYDENPDGTPKRRRRRRKSSKRRTRKSRSTRRSKARTRRKSKKRSTGKRRLKFGSAAYRKKYLGHK